MGMTTAHKTFEKTCEQCGNSFTAGRSYVKFCSASCASRYGNVLRYGPKVEKTPTPCETCGTTPEAVYATGRFCSSKCARSYSTSKSRDAISKKTSSTLKGKQKPLSKAKARWEEAGRSKQCRECGSLFQTTWKGRGREYCSNTCINNHSSGLMIQRNIEGNFYQSFGRRVRYTERGQDIRCDSLIEWCALEHLFQTYGDRIASVERSSLRIPYKLEGKQRIYNPDFEVSLTDGTRLVVECKSEQSGKSEIWVRYHKESSIKREALEAWCRDNGDTFVWFTQKTRGDLYRRLKDLHPV